MFVCVVCQIVLLIHTIFLCNDICPHSLFNVFVLILNAFM